MGFLNFSPVYRTVGGTKRRKSKSASSKRTAAPRGFGGLLSQLSAASSMLNNAKRSVSR
jgi:hypothetical protein